MCTFQDVQMYIIVKCNECIARFEFSENVKAAKELMENYDDDFMGKIALKILNMHMEKKICYQFDEEAEKVFESIIN